MRIVFKNKARQPESTLTGTLVEVNGTSATIDLDDGSRVQCSILDFVGVELSESMAALFRITALVLSEPRRETFPPEPKLSLATKVGDGDLINSYINQKPFSSSLPIQLGTPASPSFGLGISLGTPASHQYAYGPGSPGKLSIQSAQFRPAEEPAPSSEVIRTVEVEHISTKRMYVKRTEDIKADLDKANADFKKGNPDAEVLSVRDPLDTSVTLSSGM